MLSVVGVPKYRARILPTSALDAAAVMTAAPSALKRAVGHDGGDVRFLAIYDRFAPNTGREPR